MRLFCQLSLRTTPFCHPALRGPLTLGRSVRFALSASAFGTAPAGRMPYVTAYILAPRANGRAAAGSSAVLLHCIVFFNIRISGTLALQAHLQKSPFKL